MKPHNRINGARLSALTLAAAITVAGALGLTTASENTPRPRAVSSYVPSITPPAPIDDPALMQIDQSCEHHC
ncbi:MAG: hypothetical protein ACXW16_11900 [Burkholderiaceae bacterium]